MSSLKGKCVFYRQQHNVKGGPMELNFGDLKMQKRNIPTDGAQRVVEKNWVIYLVFTFTPGVMVTKMP